MLLRQYTGHADAAMVVGALPMRFRFTDTRCVLVSRYAVHVAAAQAGRRHAHTFPDDAMAGPWAMQWLWAALGYCIVCAALATNDHAADAVAPYTAV